MTALQPLWEATQNPVILVILVILAVWGTISERMASIRGPLGSAARVFRNWQKNRVVKEREIEHERNLAKDQVYGTLNRRLDLLARQVDDQQAQHELDIEELKRDHTAEMAQLRTELVAKNGHIIALLRWAHLVRSKAAAVGLDLPAPPEAGE